MAGKDGMARPVRNSVLSMKKGRLIVCSLSLLACNDILGVEPRSLDGGGGSGGAGHSPSGGGGDGDGGARFDCPILECGTSCVDPFSSTEDCGACGNGCDAGACMAGVCDRRVRSAPGARGQCVRGPSGLACWGFAADGESGTGVANVPEGFPARPVTVLPEDPAASFAVATGHSACALLADGTIRCYGSNLEGALGLSVSGGPDDGSEAGCCYVTESVTPEVPSDKTFVDIAAGGASWFNGFFVALSADGDAYCWGSHAAPQLKLSNVAQVVAGASFACALEKTGEVWCWGGWWGAGESNDVCNQPAGPIPGLDHVRVIGGGHIGAFAVRQDNSVYAWGNNIYGGLGPGFVVSLSYFPAKRLAYDFPSDVLQIVGTHSATCALLASGDVYCWGENGHQGDGTVFNGSVDTTPHRAAIEDVTQLGSSMLDFTAIDRSGHAFVWSGFYDGMHLPTELVLP